MNIYVASSWRNARQPTVVAALRGCGFDVYDFRNPVPGDNGFHWSEIDSDWESWGPREYVTGLLHPLAEKGFTRDMEALRAADAVVLVLPCGRSSHLEAGWAAGAGKPVYILVEDAIEPELMYKMATAIERDLAPILAALGAPGAQEV